MKRFIGFAVAAVCVMPGCSSEDQSPDIPLQPQSGATIISTYSPKQSVRGSMVDMDSNASLRLDNTAQSHLLVNLGKREGGEIPATAMITLTPENGSEPLTLPGVNQVLLNLPIGGYYIDLSSDTGEPLHATVSVEEVHEAETSWSTITSAIWTQTVGAALEKEACGRVIDDLEAHGRVCFAGADRDAPTNMNCWAKALASCEGP